MAKRIMGCFALLSVFIGTALPAFADEATAVDPAPTEHGGNPPQKFEFTNGFSDLKDQIGDVMGDPITPEMKARPAPVPSEGNDTIGPLAEPDTVADANSADIVQFTTTGMAYWSADQYNPSFTDGWHRWALTAGGVTNWEGTDNAPPQKILSAPSRAPTNSLASAPAPSVSVSGVWSALASCEATGNWHANTGNGYYGGLQEDMKFWANYGGYAYAARPDLASPAAQVAVAQRGQASQGWGAWPVCSRRLGLR
jgi:hypothetical protein